MASLYDYTKAIREAQRLAIEMKKNKSAITSNTNDTKELKEFKAQINILIDDMLAVLVGFENSLFDINAELVELKESNTQIQQLKENIETINVELVELKESNAEMQTLKNNIETINVEIAEIKSMLNG